MRYICYTIISSLMFFLFFGDSLNAQKKQIYPSKLKKGQKGFVDTRIDNMKYWNDLLSRGLVKPNPQIDIPPASMPNSKIDAKSVKTEDSPDIAVSNSRQSEVSVFIDPNNNENVINSNNSGDNELFYGTSFFCSMDQGETWAGQVSGTGGENYGDPSATINLKGRMFVGFIHSNFGQGVAYSDDQGLTWTSVQAGNNPGDMLDKNHLWVDNSTTSPYQDYLYNAWTNYGGDYDGEIGIVSSVDDGLSYSDEIIISEGVAAGSHNQGVNVQTGPNGEVYVVWAIYDYWPSDETALGFTKSLDGGQTFAISTRIIDNIRGIRTSKTTKNMRVNSFPSMAVDISGGENDGNIYIVWTNIGSPGNNTGSNISIYMIKSEDKGETWSTPIKVNQAAFENGKEAYFPWITCDPVTGTLSVIFYDDRNVSITNVETWVANSFDGGETWEDFKVSDVSFTPNPVPNAAPQYMGDYLGIASRGGIVYPMWPDWRSGELQTYVSPFVTNTLPMPENLQAAINQSTGEVNLTWDPPSTKDVLYYNVYLDNELLGSSNTLFYSDYLENYGYYRYGVTAISEEGESMPIKENVQYGAPLIVTDQNELSAILGENQQIVEQLIIGNQGQLPLEYSLSTVITSKVYAKDYCGASGGCEEYIGRVVFGEIDNLSACNGYYDYTHKSTSVNAGETYQLTVENGDGYANDDLGVWIDWNQDGDFEDEDENVVCAPDNYGEGTFDIEIPTSAVPGPTVMRIRIKYAGANCGEPCGNTTYGEVEDYTVNVNNWLTYNQSQGVIEPNGSDLIHVVFASNGLPNGNYTADIIIASNDSQIPEKTIPCSLEVVAEAPFVANPYSNPSIICETESAQVFANVSGGNGNYTYIWSSDPIGFSSMNENIEVSPEVTTTYTVEASDGHTTVSASEVITVNNIPEITEAPEGEVIVQNNGPNTTYTTIGSFFASEYEWTIEPQEAGAISGSGSIGIVNWSDDYLGDASISVRGINDCGIGEFSESLLVSVIDNLSVEDKNTISMNIYPNPTDGRIIVEFNSKHEDVLSLTVYNAIGAKVIEMPELEVWAKKSLLIDFGDQPSGSYFIHYISGSNSEIRCVFKH